MVIDRDISSSAEQFTDTQLLDRDLVIRMLTWESDYMCSEAGQARYKQSGSGQFTSLDNEYAFNRMVLRNFGFTTDDSSVANYRRIFQTYFHNPDDYDTEVIGSSHYMRNNRCVFYKTPEIKCGDVIPNVPLLTPDSQNITLYEAINKHKLDNGNEWARLFICAFSNS